MREGITKGDISYYYKIHRERCGAYSVSYETFRRRLYKMPLKQAIYTPLTNKPRADKIKYTMYVNDKAEEMNRKANLIDEGIDMMSGRKAFYGPEMWSPKVIEVPYEKIEEAIEKKKKRQRKPTWIPCPKELAPKETLWEKIKGLFGL